jgi:hypothetical protein
MTNFLSKRAAVLCFGVLSTPVVLADFDGSDPLLCASVEVYECTAGADCDPVTAESVDAPQFFSIDFRAETMIGSDGVTDGVPSAVQSMTLIGDQLILQGIDETVAWTLSIAQVTGKLIAVATGDDAGFVIFGACRVAS